MKTIVALMIAALAAGVAGAGTVAKPMTFAQLSRIVTKGSGGNLALQRGSACDFRKGIRGSKIVNLPGPGICSLATKLTRTPFFGSESEVLRPTWGVFALLFPQAHDPRGRPVRSIFISITGPIRTVGGKIKYDVIINADCSRAAAKQIDWKNIDTAGFEQLCKVRKFVKFG